MKAGGLSSVPPMGGKGKAVEADETYFHNLAYEDRPKVKTDGTPANLTTNTGWNIKRTIVSLVERGAGVRSFHVAHAHLPEVVKVVSENAAKESRLHTDASRLYKRVGKEFTAHESVNHSQKEWARRRDDQHRRKLFLGVQARHEGHVSALRYPPPAPLPRGVGFPLQQPLVSRH